MVVNELVMENRKVAVWLLVWLGIAESLKGENVQGLSNCDVNLEGTCGEKGEIMEEFTCDLFLAPSAIPNAGWGLFTGRALATGEPIGPSDVAVHVYDYYEHFSETRKSAEKLKHWPLTDYWYNAAVTGYIFEAEQVHALLPGIGMLTNSFPTLANLEVEGCHDKEPVHRDSDIRNGAVSDCNQVVFSTNQDLPAGHELLTEYGDDWFRSYYNDEGEASLAQDFLAVDDLLSEWEHDLSGDLDSDQAAAAYKKLRKDVTKSSRWRLLPKNAKEAAEIVYGEQQGMPMTIARSKLPNLIRSAEWLNANGHCIDGIVTRKLLPREDSNTTGYAAFSKRPVSVGSVLVPVPVLHLSRSHLAMSDGNHQLLLNYCYGHPASSLLLFPYAPGVNFIHHSSSNANVILRWSDSPLATVNDEWSQLTVDELLEINDPTIEPRHLLMELVAIRDIAAGEELLMDFGADWEKSWNEHLRQPSPIGRGGHLPSAWHYNEASEIFTVQESDKYPPDHIQVRCWVQRDVLEDPTDGKGLWHKWVPSEEEQSLSETEPCTVVGVDNDETYQIVLDDGNIHVKGVPWSAIGFFNKPYSSPHFASWAFRHEIGIPQHLFPARWIDIDEVNKLPMNKTDGSNNVTNEAQKDAEDTRESHIALLQDDDAPELGCGLFMAESSIPNAGLGMYTARAIPANMTIFHGDVVCNVEDFSRNMKIHHDISGDKSHEGHDDWLLDNYYWNSGATLSLSEAHDIASIVPGLGMLANSHPGLVNALLIPPTKIVGLHRGRDPGAGAYSLYHNVTFYAKNGPIEAGSELFVEYGDDWFINHEDDIGEVPLSDDYKQADEIMNQFWKIIEGDTTTKLSSEVWLLVMKAVEGQPRVRQLLPNSFQQIESYRNKGNAGQNSVKDSVKSIAWLEENGRCLDNIRPGPSTIGQAGLGAFATRRIKKGSTIAPLPMVHIFRHHMEVYEQPKRGTKRIGTQLLLNYCYGHPESSLLLFPYSPVVNYINHNQTLSNSFLQWSNHPFHHKEWLDLDLDDLKSHNHAGLIMELVALRDIEEGEEVFLDYGDSWEKAWEEYRSVIWKPTDADKKYVSAAEFNESMKILRTKSELTKNPYGSKNVVLGCSTASFADEDEDSDAIESSTSYEWKDDPELLTNSFFMYPCDVVKRHENSNLYDVMILRKDRPDTLVTDVPRHAIRFLDDYYTSDLFLRSAFRHEVSIPDKMFPQAWRDLKVSPKKYKLAGFW